MGYPVDKLFDVDGFAAQIRNQAIAIAVHRVITATGRFDCLVVDTAAVDGFIVGGAGFAMGKITPASGTNFFRSLAGSKTLVELLARFRKLPKHLHLLPFKFQYMRVQPAARGFADGAVVDHLRCLICRGSSLKVGSAY